MNNNNIVKKIFNIKNKKSQMLAWDSLGKYIVGALILLIVIVIIGLLSKNMLGNTEIAFNLFG